MSKLHLKSLVTQFRREWIVSSVILALTEEQIEQLGVSAIGDRVRLRLLQRMFEENSAETFTGGGNVATSSERPSADAIRQGIEMQPRRQLKIYLRPIQRNLSTESLIPQNSYEVKERCTSFKKKFPMSELRTHSFYMRTASLNSDSDSEGQTTKESLTLESKIHALPVDNPL